MSMLPVMKLEALPCILNPGQGAPVYGLLVRQLNNNGGAAPSSVGQTTPQMLTVGSNGALIPTDPVPPGVVATQKQPQFYPATGNVYARNGPVTLAQQRPNSQGQGPVYVPAPPNYATAAAGNRGHQQFEQQQQQQQVVYGCYSGGQRGQQFAPQQSQQQLPQYVDQYQQQQQLMNSNVQQQNNGDNTTVIHNLQTLNPAASGSYFAHAASFPGAGLTADDDSFLQQINADEIASYLDPETLANFDSSFAEGCGAGDGYVPGGSSDTSDSFTPNCLLAAATSTKQQQQSHMHNMQQQTSNKTTVPVSYEGYLGSTNLRVMPHPPAPVANQAPPNLPSSQAGKVVAMQSWHNSHHNHYANSDSTGSPDSGIQSVAGSPAAQPSPFNMTSPSPASQHHSNFHSQPSPRLPYLPLHGGGFTYHDLQPSSSSGMNQSSCCAAAPTSLKPLTVETNYDPISDSDFSPMTTDSSSLSSIKAGNSSSSSSKRERTSRPSRSRRMDFSDMPVLEAEGLECGSSAKSKPSKSKRTTAVTKKNKAQPQDLTKAGGTTLPVLDQKVTTLSKKLDAVSKDMIAVQKQQKTSAPQNPVTPSAAANNVIAIDPQTDSHTLVDTIISVIPKDQLHVFAKVLESKLTGAAPVADEPTPKPSTTPVPPEPESSFVSQSQEFTKFERNVKAPKCAQPAPINKEMLEKLQRYRTSKVVVDPAFINTVNALADRLALIYHEDVVIEISGKICQSFSNVWFRDVLSRMDQRSQALALEKAGLACCSLPPNLEAEASSDDSSDGDFRSSAVAPSLSPDLARLSECFDHNLVVASEKPGHNFSLKIKLGLLRKRKCPSSTLDQVASENGSQLDSSLSVFASQKYTPDDALPTLCTKRVPLPLNLKSQDLAVPIPEKKGKLTSPQSKSISPKISPVDLLSSVSTDEPKKTKKRRHRANVYPWDKKKGRRQHSSGSTEVRCTYCRKPLPENYSSETSELICAVCVALPIARRMTLLHKRNRRRMKRLSAVAGAAGAMKRNGESAAASSVRCKLILRRNPTKTDFSVKVVDQQSSSEDAKQTGSSTVAMQKSRSVVQSQPTRILPPGKQYRTCGLGANNGAQGVTSGMPLLHPKQCMLLNHVIEVENFKLPYELWWDYVHQKNTDFYGNPSRNYKEISSNIYVDPKPSCSYRSHACTCEPNEEPACGESCLNRLMFAECSPNDCPCGDRCTNQRIERRDWTPELQKFDAGQRGFGLRTLCPIAQGAFVCEYTGEVVSTDTFWKRMSSWYKNSPHHYALNLDGGTVVDAYRCGSLARFINHSCEPNCEMQKWVTPGGHYRMAIFALRDISPLEELTYDYKFDSFSADQSCHCGSKKCRRLIAPKAVTCTTKTNKQKRKMAVGANKVRCDPNALRVQLAQSLKPLSHRERERVQKRSIFLLRNVDRIRKRLRVNGEEGNDRKRSDLLLALKKARGIKPIGEASESESKQLYAECKREQLPLSCSEGIPSCSAASEIEMKVDDPEEPLVGSYNTDDDTGLWDSIAASSSREDMEVVRCPCGIFEDDGPMINCDRCNFWLHQDCVGVKTVSDTEPYYCDRCLGKPWPKDIALVPQPEITLPGCFYYRTLTNSNGLQMKIGETVYVMRNVSEEHKATLRAFHKATLCEENLNSHNQLDASSLKSEPMEINQQRSTPQQLYHREDLRIFRVDRLFTGANGQRFAFGWYYAKPNETFCEPSRRFYKNELFATPLWDTLPLDVVVARCLVLDPSTYCKGRPRYPVFVEQDVYICECRLDKNQRLFEKLKKSKCIRQVAHSKYEEYLFREFDTKLTIKRDFTPFADAMIEPGLVKRQDSDEVPLAVLATYSKKERKVEHLEKVVCSIGSSNNNNNVCKDDLGSPFS